MLALADQFAPGMADEELEELLEDWRSIQVDRNLPEFTLKEVDLWWGKVLLPKGAPGLSAIIKTLLILPYNQAPVERIFSMVTKIDTKFRPTLKDTTLTSLIRCKVNLFSNCNCYELPCTPDFLKSVKSSAMKSNASYAKN